MARYNTVLKKIENAFAVPDFPVDGFDFVLDNGEDEPEEVLPLKEGMPRVKGFKYEFEGKLYGEKQIFR